MIAIHSSIKVCALQQLFRLVQAGTVSKIRCFSADVVVGGVECTVVVYNSSG